MNTSIQETSTTPSPTESIITQAPFSIQVGPFLDAETINRRAEYGYDLTLDIPKEVHPFMIDRLLESTDTTYLGLVNLKRTCMFFYQMVNQLMLEFIKNQHNSKAFLSNQFVILSCQDSNLIPDCLTANLHKATTLFCLASVHPNIIACQVYVKIFKHHVNNLLAHSEKSDFKFQVSQDNNNFSLLDLGNLTTFSVNKYLFTKFLERYISHHKFIDLVNSTSDEDELKWNRMVDFLVQSQSMEGIFDLINQLIDKLSLNASDDDNAYVKLWSLSTLMDHGLIQENAAHYLLPIIISCLKLVDNSYVEQISMALLCSFAKKGFLASKQAQDFIEKAIICSKYEEESKIDAAVEAINLIAELIREDFINEQNIIQEYIHIIIQRLGSINNKIVSAILYALFVISKSKFLNFQEIDCLIPQILVFLQHENMCDRNNAVSLIQALAEKDFETKYSDALMESFLIILLQENHSHYEIIIDLCKKLFKTDLIIKNDSLMQKLKDIAIKNLKNTSDAIRAHAVELLSLVAPQEEQNKIVSTLIIQSILDCYKQSPIDSNFDQNNLITFFKNLDLNQRELTEKAITLISDFIDHQTRENL